MPDKVHHDAAYEEAALPCDEHGNEVGNSPHNTSARLRDSAMLPLADELALFWIPKGCLKEFSQK